MLINYIDIPKELWKGIYQTGSSVICSPPVLDTDIDFVICAENIVEFDKFITASGFIESSQDEEEYDIQGEGFSCYRKDNINLIITTNYKWYLQWVVATNLAKKLNLLKKEDRVTLFKFVLYGEC